MSTTTTYNYYNNINSVRSQDGSLEFTYTMNNDGSISNASFRYKGPNSSDQWQGPYPITFTGTTSPYSGTCSMNPPTYSPLNISGQGSYKSGVMSFDTATNATYALSGTFRQAGLTGDPGDLSWDASSGSQSAEAYKAKGS